MHWLIYVFGVGMAWIVLSQVFALWEAKRSIGRLAPDTTAVASSASEHGQRVYYFYAPHCGACRAINPLIDRLAVAHPNLIKLNVAESPALARDFGVRATPAFVQIKEGLIQQVRLGAQSERRILGMLLESDQNELT